MFDPNENKNEFAWTENRINSTSGNSTPASDDMNINSDHQPPNGEYRYVRNSAAGNPYAEASFTPVSENRNSVPRYYYSDAQQSRMRRSEKKQKKNEISMGKLVAVCLICAIIGGLFGAGGVALFDRASDGEGIVAQESGQSAALDPNGSIQPPESPNEQVSEGPILTAVEDTESINAESVYNLACTQVVGITTEITYTNYFGMTTSSAVTGSGFIVTEDGYIITNHHVIENAYKGGYDVSVMLYNGDSYTATIVGFEEDNDIAVLKIDATGLSPVEVGDSDAMSVGETVYAVGNPLGELAYTMTKGMVSALDRDISSTDEETGLITTINMFQIDAAVNSGNSGGPVYNSRGQVIGVVTAKYSSTGVEGIGFAVPINDAVTIANDIIVNGYVSGKAYFGISVRTVSASVAEYYNMVEGAYISIVDENSCAGAAGLQVGDIITAVDEYEIKSSSDLVAAKKEYKAGDSAELTVYRYGEYFETTIVFDEEKPTETAQPQARQDAQQDQMFPGR